MIEPVVKLIALTQVDWSIIIESFTEHLNFSPARVLDASNIKLDDPMSLTFVINTLKDDCFDPKKDKVQPHSLTHTHVGFIAYCDYYTILEISEVSTLNISTKGIDQIAVLAILTGNLDEWTRTILAGCTKNMRKSTRLLLNQCFFHFNNTSIGKLFTGFSRSKLADGTLVIEAKND